MHCEIVMIKSGEILKLYVHSKCFSCLPVMMASQHHNNRAYFANRFFLKRPPLLFSIYEHLRYFSSCCLEVSAVDNNKQHITLSTVLTVDVSDDRG